MSSYYLRKLSGSDREALQSFTKRFDIDLNNIIDQQTSRMQGFILINSHLLAKQLDEKIVDYDHQRNVYKGKSGVKLKDVLKEICCNNKNQFNVVCKLAKLGDRRVNYGL